MESKKITLLTLCDLSKAFDSVSHNILLKKCSALKIDVFWFKNYIENRAQSVRLNNTTSNKLSVATRFYSRSRSIFDLCKRP